MRTIRRTKVFKRDYKRVKKGKHGKELDIILSRARLELVDAILTSLDEPDQEIDRLWSQEAGERLAAYRRGEIRAIPLNEVLAKYNIPG